MRKQTTYWNSPLGTTKIQATQEKITSICFTDYTFNNCKSDNKLLNQCILQLQEYFDGTRQHFSLPYKTEGTEFQKKVWLELEKIRYGHMATYKDIAVAVNNSNSCRAAGNAVRANPLPIIIPCHRVIGTDGSLTGFSSGLWRKKWLLEHEKKQYLASALPRQEK